MLSAFSISLWFIIPIFGGIILGALVFGLIYCVLEGSLASPKRKANLAYEAEKLNRDLQRIKNAAIIEALKRSK